jgi:catechol 2,3-dioxygenase-like lactoylglutathione lyase family enzyme
MELELQHIDILTSDVEKSIAFYREKLGMQLASRFYREGVFDIAFLRDGPESTQFAIELVGPPFTSWMEDLYKKHGPSMDHYSFVVDDVDAWYEKLRASGAEIVAPPERFLTVKEMYFRDPGGIVVEMMAFADPGLAPRAPVGAPARPGIEYHLNHISLLCHDLAASERFYIETLGLDTIYDRRETGFILVADPVFLADAEREAPTLEIMGPEAPWDREQTFLAEHGPGLDHICFVVDDVDAAHDDLRSKGVEFFQEPEDMGSNRLAWFYDPNGVQVELMLPIPRDRMLK